MNKISKLEKQVESELAYLIDQKPFLGPQGIDTQLKVAVKMNLMTPGAAGTYRLGKRFAHYNKRFELKQKRGDQPKAAAAAA